MTSKKQRGGTVGTLEGLALPGMFLALRKWWSSRSKPQSGGNRRGGQKGTRKRRRN